MLQSKTNHSFQSLAFYEIPPLGCRRAVSCGIAVPGSLRGDNPYLFGEKPRRFGTRWEPQPCHGGEEAGQGGFDGETELPRPEFRVLQSQDGIIWAC